MIRKEKNKIVRNFRRDAVEILTILKNENLSKTEVNNLWQVFTCLLEEVVYEGVDKRKKVHTISAYVVKKFLEVDSTVGLTTAS